MAGIDNNLNLGVGFVSNNKDLGAYYQNISPAIIHISNGVFANLDENNIPYCIDGDKRNYVPVLIIQYALMCHDLVIQEKDIDVNKTKIIQCINWLESKKQKFNDSVVWRSHANSQYDLQEGWISGMYQGQAISLYLRAYQLFNNEKYFKTAQEIFNSFKYDYTEGGFKRIDQQGCVWFEEYPSSTPSYVLNGFIYSILGVYDLYRVTNSTAAKELWDSCIHTLEVNLNKYDVWHWSVYDQLKEQLVSYYYQKNVHIPLMQILYLITNKSVFNFYAIKWNNSLNNPFHRFITQIMYRIQPRLKKIL